MIKDFFIVLLFSSLALTDDPTPFWRSKPEVYKKMKEERYVVVSAHTQSVGEEKKLTIISAGIIHAPVEFTHQRVLEFKKYPEFLSYIVDSPYDETTKNIFLHGAVLGYHVHMTLHIDTEKTEKGEKIHWKSIEGGFKGMEGTIIEDPPKDSNDNEHTEISLDAAYLGKTIGLPGVILDWGLEFAAQRTATAMRSHIESEWEKSKKH